MGERAGLRGCDAEERRKANANRKGCVVEAAGSVHVEDHGEGGTAHRHGRLDRGIAEMDGRGVWDSATGPAAHTGGMQRLIPIDCVRPSPYQARRHFDPERLAELADTVREHGVVQPLLVRPCPGGFELVAGERRWRAARLAGLVEVPAVVRELSDQDAAVLSMVENLQRDDLPFFDEAAGYRRLMDEFKLSQEEVAQWVGRSQPSVANKLRLLNLQEVVRERVFTAGLTERHARALLRLESCADRLAAVDGFVVQRMTVREAEAWVERLVSGGAEKKGNPTVEARPAVRTEVPPRLRQAFAVTARGLRDAGYLVRMRRRMVGDTLEVVVRVRGVEGGAGPKRRRA